jgi:acetyltransferase-like isoleucine patch superfamily enzyme
MKFQFYYRGKFNSCGDKVSLFEPIRIDGFKDISIGSKVSIQANTWLYVESQTGFALEIGDGTVLGYNNHITAIKDVKIGKNVLTANNVYISDNSHEYEDINVPIIKQPVRFLGPTYIGDGSWLGENVCIFGSTVGKNCVIGSNSVVTKNIPDFCVAVGSPAKIIKKFNLDTKKWEKFKDE